MQWGGMGLESGKGGRNTGRDRDSGRDRDVGRDRDAHKADAWSFRDHGRFTDRGYGNATDSLASKSSYTNGAGKNTDYASTASTATAITGLENKLESVQKEFTQSVHRIKEKENEKFDLIFSILSELQGKQAQLEESVRSLTTYGSGQLGGHVVGDAMGPAQTTPQQHLQQQFASNNGTASACQTYSQMNGQMTGPIGISPQIQQLTGVMQSDGTQAMFTAVPQMVVVTSPQGPGVPYPLNQMAMQFIGACPQGASGFAMSGAGPGALPIGTNAAPSFDGPTQGTLAGGPPADVEQKEG